MFKSVNPTTGELLKEFPFHSDSEREKIVACADKEKASWKKRSIIERIDLVLKLSGLLEKHVPLLARTAALEMGKPIAQAEAEVKKCAFASKTLAHHAEEWLKDHHIPLENENARVIHEPLGTILAIMPWNFPFWQVIRAAIPSLLSGNVFLLKHAPNVPGCALELEKVFREAGFPEGAFQNLFLSNEETEKLISDVRISGVTLTGSARAGRSVAKVAGENLKPVILELGGSDPFIIFSDSNLEEAINAALLSKNANNGQVCIAPKRFFVEESIYKHFRDAFVERMCKRVVGDPADSKTDNGPLARSDLKETLISQVKRTVEAGAKIVGQGRIGGDHGFFYPPTVLEDVPTNSPAFSEELFGPVAAIAPFKNDDEVLHLANSTRFGLGATIWSENPERVQHIARDLEVGHVAVNTIVSTHPLLPFGGTKDSGFGRELGEEGMKSFTKCKVIVQKS